MLALLVDLSKSFGHLRCSSDSLAEDVLVDMLTGLLVIVVVAVDDDRRVWTVVVLQG